MSFPMALFVTVVLLAASGFFVAAGFALVAAKRHRMEKAAAEGQRGAKAALAGMRELSLMLAGAQLGITICTLGLGSISKPAISHQVDPLLVKLGLPAGLSYGIAFAFAMALVVFLHMVVGEMAPKSWAIAHPERSAMLLSPPFRATVAVVRPLIRVLNTVSNALVRMCRVQPREELTAVHNREQLTHLVAESERLGLINATDSELITRSLTEPQTPVADLMVHADRIVTVPADAGIDTVLETATAADRARLLVTDGQTVLGSVHARDALVARAPRTRHHSPAPGPARTGADGHGQPLPRGRATPQAPRLPRRHPGRRRKADRPDQPRRPPRPPHGLTRHVGTRAAGPAPRACMRKGQVTAPAGVRGGGSTHRPGRISRRRRGAPADARPGTTCPSPRPPAGSGDPPGRHRQVHDEMGAPPAAHPVPSAKTRRPFTHHTTDRSPKATREIHPRPGGDGRIPVVVAAPVHVVGQLQHLRVVRVVLEHVDLLAAVPPRPDRRPRPQRPGQPHLASRTSPVRTMKSSRLPSVVSSPVFHSPSGRSAARNAPRRQKNGSSTRWSSFPSRD